MDISRRRRERLPPCALLRRVCRPFPDQYNVKVMRRVQINIHVSSSLLLPLVSGESAPSVRTNTVCCQTCQPQPRCVPVQVRLPVGSLCVSLCDEDDEDADEPDKDKQKIFLYFDEGLQETDFQNKSLSSTNLQSGRGQTQS